MTTQIRPRNGFSRMGLFLVIVLAFTISLTVWSLNNLSTTTEQNAATDIQTSGPKCPYLCRSNQICNPGNFLKTIPGYSCPLGTVCCTTL